MNKEEFIRSKTAIEIRRMRLNDLPEVVRLEQESFSEPWTQNGFEDALFQGQNIFIVAVDLSERIVGYVGLYVSMDEGDITNVAVSDNCRRCGIGDKLLEFLLLQAKGQGVRQIFLEVRKSNHAAQRLYEKHGFQITGERKNFYRKPQEDALLMSWEDV